MDAEVLRYAAFTAVPSGGNPAGVRFDAERLSDGEMLRIAAEIGYSETAFVTTADDERRQYRVRYFAPRSEVAFCGHATIATAVAITERVGPGTLIFHTLAGDIRVDTSRDDGRSMATLTSVATRSRPATAGEVGRALEALHWSAADLDPEFPAHVAFAGVEHLILAAASRDRLARLDYDFDALLALMEECGWTTVNLFWRERPDRFHARNPFPVGGVVEDPATGAAAAAFGGYLRALGRIPVVTRIRVRQGEDMGRVSELSVDIDPDDDRVRVTGGAVKIAPSPPG